MLLLQLPAEVLLAVWSMCPERVVAHTGVCRRLRRLLPDASSIDITIEARRGVDTSALQRFLCGVGSNQAAHRGLPRRGRRSLPGIGGNNNNRPAHSGQQDGVRIVVREAAALRPLGTAVKTHLARNASLDLAYLVKHTLPPNTFQHMLELIGACSSRLQALDLSATELRQSHVGLLSERLCGISLTSLTLAKNRLDPGGLRRLSNSACTKLTSLTHLDLSATWAPEEHASADVFCAISGWLRAATCLTSLHLNASSTSAAPVGKMKQAQGTSEAGVVETKENAAVNENYVTEVSRALSSLPRLASLRLQGHCGGRALARALVKALAHDGLTPKETPSRSSADSTPVARSGVALTDLDLSSNRLGPAGLQELEPLLIGGAVATGSCWGGRGGASNLKSLSLGGANTFGASGNGNGNGNGNGYASSSRPFQSPLASFLLHPSRITPPNVLFVCMYV